MSKGKKHIYYYEKKMNANQYFGVSEKAYPQLVGIGGFTERGAKVCYCPKGKNHYERKGSYV